MNFGDASQIEDLEGVKNSYTLTHFYKYPFKNSINNQKKLKHKDCICFALLRYKIKTNDQDLICCQIEYLENLDFFTYHNKLDINGFECSGLGIIENKSEEEAEQIIKDLESNSNFYVKNRSELL